MIYDQTNTTERVRVQPERDRYNYVQKKCTTTVYSLEAAANVNMRVESRMRGHVDFTVQSLRTYCSRNCK